MNRTVEYEGQLGLCGKWTNINKGVELNISDPYMGYMASPETGGCYVLRPIHTGGMFSSENSFEAIIQAPPPLHVVTVPITREIGGIWNFSKQVSVFGNETSFTETKTNDDVPLLVGRQNGFKIAFRPIAGLSVELNRQFVGYLESTPSFALIHMDTWQEGMVSHQHLSVIVMKLSNGLHKISIPRWGDFMR